MQPIPSHIIDFLEQNHIVNFSAHDDDDFWAANCFYALDKANARLIIFTSKKTRHAQIMLNNPKIVGTICPQVSSFTELEGMQFAESAYCLEEDNAQREAALKCYYERHPMARLKPSDVWELRFETIKHPGNKLLMVKKTEWARESGAI